MLELVAEVFTWKNMILCIWQKNLEVLLDIGFKAETTKTNTAAD